MWGMQYAHSGNLITLRSDTQCVKFRVLNEYAVDETSPFDSFVTPQQKRLIPLETPHPPSSEWLQQPEKLFRKLFKCYKRTAAVTAGQQRSDSNRRLTMQEAGRFLRTFLGAMTDQRASAIVAAARTSSGTHVDFAEFVSLCTANLPIVPCLDYLTVYLEADANEWGILTGQAAAQLLDRCGFKDAARRLRQDMSEFVSYPHFMHLAMNSRDAKVTWR